MYSFSNYLWLWVFCPIEAGSMRSLFNSSSFQGTLRMLDFVFFGDKLIHICKTMCSIELAKISIRFWNIKRSVIFYYIPFFTYLQKYWYLYLTMSDIPRVRSSGLLLYWFCCQPISTLPTEDIYMISLCLLVVVDSPLFSMKTAVCNWVDCAAMP